MTDHQSFESLSEEIKKQITSCSFDVFNYIDSLTCKYPKGVVGDSLAIGLIAFIQSSFPNEKRHETLELIIKCMKQNIDIEVISEKKHNE